MILLKFQSLPQYDIIFTVKNPITIVLLHYIIYSGEPMPDMVRCGYIFLGRLIDWGLMPTLAIS